LIAELHKSGRWPIFLYNVGYKMDGNTYSEIHQHGSYIILISGPCEEWEEHIARYLQQLYELFVGKKGALVESRSQIRCLCDVKLHAFGKHKFVQSNSQGALAS
jgi:hypothetical protein